MLGSNFGNAPGLDLPYTTYETSFGWGPAPRAFCILPRVLAAAAVDASQNPTWRNMVGLVLGQIASSGEVTNYDPTATDGSQIAVGVLMGSYRMQDVYTGSTRVKHIGMLVKGPCRAAGVHVNGGVLDQKARFDLTLQGITFDDDVRGPIPWRVVEGAFGNVTTTVSDPTAALPTYRNGTHFVVISGTGTATFTLPAILPGLRYKFSQYMDQSLVVQRAGSDVMIFDGSQTATSVTSSTSSHKIGASVEVESVYVGSATYKWLVHNTGSNPSAQPLS